MTVQLPKFNLDKSTAVFANEEELQAQIDQESVGSRFEQGSHELKIIEARYNKQCADEGWMTICLTLGTGIEGDEREIKTYQLIPLTQRVKYKKPGGKNTMFCWGKTVEFLNGIGEPSKQVDLDKFQTKYLAGDGCTKDIIYQKYDEIDEEFKDVEGLSFHKLIGKNIEVDLGYEGYYIKRVEDTDDFAVYKNNKIVVGEIEGKKVELIGDSYQDCQALMMNADIDTEKLTNLSVTKIHAGRVATVTNLELDAI